MAQKNKLSNTPFGVKLSYFLHQARITYYLRNPLLHLLAKTGIFHVVKNLPNGLKLSLNVDDKVQLELYRRGFWEQQQLDLVQKLMENGDIFVDIGAHCGSFAAPIAYEFKRARVLAFEPNPHIYQLLVETKMIGNLENLLLDNHAISNDEENMFFYVSSGATDSLAGFHPRERAHQLITVQTITLQKALSENDISHIRVMKIDIEGAEGLVLPANRELLRSELVDTILLELHVDLIENFGQTAEDIIELLKFSQFEIFYCKSLPVQLLPADWRKLVDGSNTIHILGIKKECMKSGALPKVW
jgi:FkbM family methyltransferase